MSWECYGIQHNHDGTNGKLSFIFCLLPLLSLIATSSLIFASVSASHVLSFARRPKHVWLCFYLQIMSTPSLILTPVPLSVVWVTFSSANSATAVHGPGKYYSQSRDFLGSLGATAEETDFYPDTSGWNSGTFPGSCNGSMAIRKVPYTNWTEHPAVLFSDCSLNDLFVA